MTTEFTIAVADINKGRCQNALFNEYDLVTDTSNKADSDSNGRWIMNNESGRRNIYMWGTDQPIDNVINGIPGNESYLCIPKNIDSVLGELKDEDLESRDKIQYQVSRELKWGMNMQSQEWKTDDHNKPIVECRFGSLYARDHHFESLVFYRNAIPSLNCSHATFNQFYDHIYSDLHHIVQNTIYLVDYTYKVRCIDNEPYRYPMGIIFPYKTINEEDYTQYQNNDLFSNDFNKFLKKPNYNNVIYIDENQTTDEDIREDFINLDKNRGDLFDDIKRINEKIQEMESKKSEYNYISNETFDKILVDYKEKKKQLIEEIDNLNNRIQTCNRIRCSYVDKKEEIHDNQLYQLTDNYDYRDSMLTNEDDIIKRFDGSISNSMKKEIKNDGKITGFETRINMKDKGLKNAKEIQDEYDKIGNQDVNIQTKWLDIKRSTLGYYKSNGKLTMGYGPLKVEGILTATAFADMRNDPQFVDLVKLIDGREKTQPEINVSILCKQFSDYSKSHMNYQIDFIEDDSICMKLRNSLNLLFNQGKDNEQSSISTIHNNGWTVHPINVRAYTNISKTQQPEYYKNVAKLGILLSQVYGGYVDNNCPIHVLRGGMLYANSLFGNVYDILKKRFNWDIYITNNNMGWQVPKDSKIRPMVRMNVYENTFIRGRAGICWNFFWNESCKVNSLDGYPHFNEDTSFTESIFNEQNIRVFYQNMLNAERWDNIHTELDDLLRDESRFYKKDITLDFYLDDKEILVTPSYYGKQIYYNVIANCNYKCVATQTNRTNTTDKNEFKHTSAQRLLVPDIWFKPFQNQYDKALICEGRAINTTQQARGRLERTYVDAMARDAEFRKYVGVSEKDIVDNQCPITYSGKYVPWKFFSQLFSLYVNFMPINIREKIQSKFKEIILYPEIQRYDIDYNVSSICSGIYNIFIYAYNADKLSTDRDIYIYLRNYQSAKGEERLYLLKRNIPALYNLIIDFQGDSVDEFFVLNFLFLLGCSNINSAVFKETYVPICYCRSSNILLTSIKLIRSREKNFFSRYVPYLSRFFGINQHRRWRNSNELFSELRKKAIDYYIGEVIVNISTELNIRQTKSQNVAMWLGSKCGGVSEAVLIFQAITYPKAAYILIVLGDENMDYDRVYKDIRYNYQISFNSCKGVVMCIIKDRNIQEFKVLGTVKARKMLRTFWGLSHDMLLIKSPGDIFGNPHIVTKLMNI
uniref:Outer capsid protein VP2 n=1 Tax=Changuinola virus TaxID=40052 RepID=U5YJ54_9REOV|nr:outer capsid protein VP2 [Changuinola virus]